MIDVFFYQKSVIKSQFLNKTKLTSVRLVFVLNLGAFVNDDVRLNAIETGSVLE